MPLQLENTDYGGSTALSQSQLFANTVASVGAGNVGAISITLGFNELAALAPATPGAPQPTAAQVQAALAAYQASYATVLNQVHTLAPGADLYVLGYYNPFPADPGSPAARLFDTYGTELNGIIQGLAAQVGGRFVNNSGPFVGHEAQYTYQAA